MKWLMLLLAGIFEIIWAIAMKYSNGFSVLIPSIITAIGRVGRNFSNVSSLACVTRFFLSERQRILLAKLLEKKQVLLQEMILI